MSRKRIAVITARADSTEQKEIICGISEAAFASDADVVVYSNIYNHWSEDIQLNYENIIYTLFEPDGFDGAIITAEAFRDISIIDGVFDKLRSSKLPTVVIGGEKDGCSSVYSDDESDMEMIAEHLITVHGITDIDILTGPESDRVSARRVEGCLRAFRNHGISVDVGKIHYGNFWNDSGEVLAQRYISGELPMPRAVICANDHMAYGLCDALTSAGILIPEQLAVISYDYTGDRIYHHPLLTSCLRNRRKMGEDAVNVLLGCEYHKKDNDRLVYGNTCGCGENEAQLVDELRSERISQYHTIMSSVAQFSSRLTLCRTLLEYTNVLTEFYYLLHDVEELALCLDAAWNSSAFDGEEFLLCRIKDGINSAPVKIDKSEISVCCSNGVDAPSIAYISPICFQTRLFGYAVLKYNHPAGYDFSYRDWSKVVSDTLEFLRMKNDIHYLTQCQRESSLYDSLTGFYNLREFRQIVDTVAGERSMSAVKLSFPANGEYIYGENFKAEILSAVAKAIKQACCGHEICCRAGEDIFLVMSNESEHILTHKMRILLHNSMCGKYDERQVIISFAEYNGKLTKATIEQLCSDVCNQSELDDMKLTKRQALQHYNALLDIRNSMFASPEKALSLPAVSKKFCVSEGYFRSVYKQCFEVSFNQDQINAKVAKACYLLSTTAMSVYGVSVSCGYSDEKYFARQFKQCIGYSPLVYRKRFLVSAN